MSIEVLKWFLSSLAFSLLWLFGFKVMDKERIHEIFNYGLLWALILMILQSFEQQVLLGNLSKLSSFFTFPIHLALLPVIFMVLYQLFVTPTFFYVAVIIVSMILSTFFELMLYLLKLSHHPSLSYFHSLCLLILLASITRILADKLKT
ncbi:MAG TPA: hypothetical protein VE710_02415 [Candidatus Bathyarchaeia archaeon]|nr:hypothetical protein [Candidatus Bathyarchaeia archaeon]